MRLEGKIRNCSPNFCKRRKHRSNRYRLPYHKYFYRRRRTPLGVYLSKNSFYFKIIFLYLICNKLLVNPLIMKKENYDSKSSRKNENFPQTKKTLLTQFIDWFRDFIDNAE